MISCRVFSLSSVSETTHHDSLTDVMSVWLFQDEHYEEEEGDEEGIVSSSFGGRVKELYDLPESEGMFLPSNMDATHLSFKFKEVLHYTSLHYKFTSCI